MRRLLPMVIPALVLVGTTPLAFASTPHAAHVSSKSSHAGQIQFGEGLKGNHLVKLATEIAKNKPVAWIAHFSKKAGTTKVTLEMIQVSGPGHHPVTTWTAKVSTSKSALTTKDSLSPKQLNHKHIKVNVHYQIQYLVGSKTLSKGKFERLNCANCTGGSGTGGY